MPRTTRRGWPTGAGIPRDSRRPSPRVAGAADAIPVLATLLKEQWAIIEKGSLLTCRGIWQVRWELGARGGACDS